MRIATWNVNSLNARLKFVLGWLKARTPDVVMIQELKLADDALPHQPFEELGYRMYAHGQPQWNGVAVLTKSEAKVTQSGLPGAESAGARLITVQQDEWKFTSVYVPNGKKIEHPDYQLKLNFLDALTSYVQSSHQPGEKAIIGGDFNLVPNEIDTHVPAQMGKSIFHTDAERSRYAKLLERGLSDLFRTKNPDERMFSWWDYRAGCFHKNQGLRIDLLLATASAQAMTDKVWIDRDYRKKQDGEIPSDHAPVIAELT